MSIGPKLVVLELTCPGAFKTSNPCAKTVIKQWFWNSCRHISYIDDGGFISCMKCTHCKHFIQNVGFKCGAETHGT